MIHNAIVWHACSSVIQVSHKALCGPGPQASQLVQGGDDVRPGIVWHTASNVAHLQGLESRLHHQQ